MRPTLCRPDEVATLLPAVIADEMVLAPLADDAARAVVLPGVDVEGIHGGVIVTTSGSSGKPKAVVLSSDSLRAAAASARERFDALGLGRITWTNALPDQYVAGLMVHVRALLEGTKVRVAGPRLDGLEPDPATANAISIVPTQLFRAMEESAVLERLARYDVVLLGGASVDPGLLERARGQGLRLITTYGMSETCGGCVWDGEPLPGVDVELDDDGRIHLGGEMVFSGYRGRPDLTEEVLVEGRVRTQDRGAWLAGAEPRRLRVLGRMDDVVVSGAVNVDLAAVQRAVDALEGSAVCPGVVVALPDAEWGQRVTLVVTEHAHDLDWYQERLRADLSGAALPRRLERLDVLPLTTSGKIDRRAIVAALTDRRAGEN